MRCPMCGSTITGDEAVCGSCPLTVGAGCSSELVRCPTCGYHSMATSARARADGDAAAVTISEPAALERRPPVDDGSGDPLGTVRRLSQVERGDSGRVVGFGDLEAPFLRDLMAHGLLPAASLRVLQRRPAYVLELSGGDVAIGAELADSILVVVGS